MNSTYPVTAWWCVCNTLALQLGCPGSDLGCDGWCASLVNFIRMKLEPGVSFALLSDWDKKFDLRIHKPVVFLLAIILEILSFCHDSDGNSLHMGSRHITSKRWKAVPFVFGNNYSGLDGRASPGRMANTTNGQAQMGANSKHNQGFP